LSIAYSVTDVREINCGSERVFTQSWLLDNTFFYEGIFYVLPSRCETGTSVSGLGSVQVNVSGE
jgi:hypothetical protein